MENESDSVLKVISVVIFFFILVSRILLILVLILLEEEYSSVTYYFGTISINLFRLAFAYAIINIVSSFVVISIVYKRWESNNKILKYLNLICCIYFLLQPVFLTILGILLLIDNRKIRFNDDNARRVNEK